MKKPTRIPEVGRAPLSGYTMHPKSGKALSFDLVRRRLDSGKELSFLEIRLTKNGEHLVHVDVPIEALADLEMAIALARGELAREAA